MKCEMNFENLGDETTTEHLRRLLDWFGCPYGVADHFEYGTGAFSETHFVWPAGEHVVKAKQTCGMLEVSIFPLTPQEVVEFFLDVDCSAGAKKDDAPYKVVDWGRMPDGTRWVKAVNNGEEMVYYKSDDGDSYDGDA